LAGSTELLGSLNSAITRALEESLAEIAEPLIEEALRKTELKLRAAIGGIAAQVVQHLSYERMGADLRITVHFPKETK
jgi:hypothetical protein